MNSEKGTTLFEVIFSLSILGIVTAGMAPAVVWQMQFNTRNEWKMGAFQVAQQRLEELREEDPSALPSSGTVGPTAYTVNNVNYEVYTTYCTVAAFCASVNSRHIEVEVQRNGETMFETQTVFTKLR